MKTEFQSSSTSYAQNARKRSKIGPNVPSSPCMTGMEVTLVLTSSRIIFTNSSSSRTVSLKTPQKRSEKDAQTVRKCSPILLSPSSTRSESSIDLALAPSAPYSLMTWSILQMLETLERFFQRTMGRSNKIFQRIIDLKDQVSKKE